MKKYVNKEGKELVVKKRIIERALPYLIGSLWMLLLLMAIEVYTYQQNIREGELFTLGENTVTEWEVFNKCNYDDNITKIECLNNLVNKYYIYDNETCLGRKYKENVTDILVNGGCCKDWAYFYNFYLTKYDIDNQLVHVPNHVYVVASIPNGELTVYNTTSRDQYVLDQRMMYQW